MQTFQKADDGEEGEFVQSDDEKGTLAKSFSQSSLHRRKSTRGSSFAGSEGDREERQKLRDISEKEEVSCVVTLFCRVFSY